MGKSNICVATSFCCLYLVTKAAKGSSDVFWLKSNGSVCSSRVFCGFRRLRRLCLPVRFSILRACDAGRTDFLSGDDLKVSFNECLRLRTLRAICSPAAFLVAVDLDDGWSNYRSCQLGIPKYG